MKRVKNFVISLANAEIRRKHILAQFNQYQIEFDFFDAITPTDIHDTSAKLGLVDYSTQLHPNEVGCLLSHMMLWKRAIDEDLDYIAIFEDDVYLGEKSDCFLKDYSWIPDQCGIIKLELMRRKIAVDLKQKKLTLPNQRQLVVLAEQHMGASGYILSQKMAQELLDFVVQSKFLIPIDHIVFREYPQATGYFIYQMSPALCIQDFKLNKGKTNFPSSLEQVRNKRKGEDFSKKNLSFHNKCKREFLRLSRQFHGMMIDHLKSYRGIKVIRLYFK